MDVNEKIILRTRQHLTFSGRVRTPPNAYKGGLMLQCNTESLLCIWIPFEEIDTIIQHGKYIPVERLCKRK